MCNIYIIIKYWIKIYFELEIKMDNNIHTFDTYYYEKGGQYYKDGQYQAALDNFNKCINKIDRHTKK